MHDEDTCGRPDEEHSTCHPFPECFCSFVQASHSPYYHRLGQLSNTRFISEREL